MRDRSTFDVVRYAPAGRVRTMHPDGEDPGPDEDHPAELEGVLYGHFSVFDRWYEIDSMWEGHFLERVAPGAFAETFANDTQRCWFEHGYSAVLDRMSLGAVEVLTEDEIGAYYEVRLFSGLPQVFVEGLAAGEYGASFRMRILAETVDSDPGVSDHNPKGLPEVTIERVSCPEFGPVSIGASPYATANLRCGTDRFYDELRSRDADAWNRARAAAGLGTDRTVGADARGSAGGEQPPDPDRGRASVARLLAAGIPLRSTTK